MCTWIALHSSFICHVRIRTQITEYAHVWYKMLTFIWVLKFKLTQVSFLTIKKDNWPFLGVIWEGEIQTLFWTIEDIKRSKHAHWWFWFVSINTWILLKHLLHNVFHRRVKINIDDINWVVKTQIGTLQSSELFQSCKWNNQSSILFILFLYFGRVLWRNQLDPYMYESYMCVCLV